MAPLATECCRRISSLCSIRKRTCLKKTLASTTRCAGRGCKSEVPAFGLRTPRVFGAVTVSDRRAGQSLGENLVEARDCVLGNIQPSLRDWFVLEMIPRTSSWATFSRPFGTGTDTTLMAGLFSASAVQMSCSKKLIWTSLTFRRPFGIKFGRGWFPRTDSD